MTEQIKHRYTGEVMCGGLSLKEVIENHRKWVAGEEDGVRADLRRAIGNLQNVKSMHLEDYHIVYTDTHLFIGCEGHLISDWWNFTDDKIEAMDGEKALNFWEKWKPVLMNIIEMSPAEPTGYIEKDD